MSRADRRLHLALGVTDVSASVDDYSQRLGCRPLVNIRGEYALWRTEMLNLSIRRVTEGDATLRHLGWEDPDAVSFTKDVDVNGIIWESFTAAQQLEEINSTWPGEQGHGSDEST